MDRYPRSIALAGGTATAALGLWAFFAPESFFDQVAKFPPYNEHLLRDVGAFLVAIGVMLVAAARIPDGLLAALAGASAGFVLHGIGHIVDRDLGGRSSDPVSLNVVAAAFVAGAILRWRARSSG